MSIKNAFDAAAQDYDSARKQLIPCFDEFYASSIKVIPFDPADNFKVLDLGAGTGLFSYLVAQLYPYAEFSLHDLSGKMMEQAKKRFSGSRVKVNFVIKDYSSENIDDQFDLIISALSIHHLTDGEKEILFQNLFSSLKPNGMFINADQVLGETPYEEEIYKSTWLNQVQEKGVAQQTLDAAFERMKEDKMSTLSDQLKWLRKAGFSEINCWYRNFSFVVYSGLKKQISL